MKRYNTAPEAQPRQGRTAAARERAPAEALPKAGTAVSEINQQHGKPFRITLANLGKAVSEINFTRQEPNGLLTAHLIPSS